MRSRPRTAATAWPCCPRSARPPDSAPRSAGCWSPRRWRCSILQTGLALTVGPAVAVVVAGPASRLAQRIGPRAVLVAGGLLWGGAVLWFVERVGVTPDFAGQ